MAMERAGETVRSVFLGGLERGLENCCLAGWLLRGFLWFVIIIIVIIMWWIVRRFCCCCLK